MVNLSIVGCRQSQYQHEEIQYRIIHFDPMLRGTYSNQSNKPRDGRLLFLLIFFSLFFKTCFQCGKEEFVVTPFSFVHASSHTRVDSPLVTPFLTVKDNMDLCLTTSCKLSFFAAKLWGATT